MGGKTLRRKTCAKSAENNNGWRRNGVSLVGTFNHVFDHAGSGLVARPGTS